MSSLLFLGIYDLKQLHCIFFELTPTSMTSVLGRDGEMGRDGETGRRKCDGYLS